MDKTYEEGISEAEALIGKACVLADAADRAKSTYIKALFCHDCNVLYARAVNIKKAAREGVVKAGMEEAN